ncbi:hypothetical protein MNVI_08280 [Mycobacterium noviomagense]|uniref:Uncharacterized protein n=1 Tax=Mycobacterium noviomagense TaxID=459858 RepID=A0A7I7PA92_9MYCO|nr:hypothetical protein MNVI_08280 [Mycobacterium noviomagense]
MGAPTGVTDLFGDLLELGLGPRRDHNVGPDLGECHGDGRAESAAGTSDDSDFVVESKIVQDHGDTVTGRAAFWNTF